MKRITYNKLMKLVEDGKYEVNAWAGDIADVTIWPTDLSKPPKREYIEVMNIPPNSR